MILMMVMVKIVVADSGDVDKNHGGGYQEAEDEAWLETPSMLQHVVLLVVRIIMTMIAVVVAMIER